VVIVAAVHNVMPIMRLDLAVRVATSQRVGQYVKEDVTQH